jgi:hypothetical protein
MAFNARNITVSGQEQQKSLQTNINFPTPNQLNARELEILLSLIKRSQFLGEDIESLYIMVIKLQNQYLDQTK